MNSKNLIKELKKSGWSLVRIKGDHHIFKHLTKKGILVIPHPKKDLPKGTEQAIRKQAGLK